MYRRKEAVHQSAGEDVRNECVTVPAAQSPDARGLQSRESRYLPWASWQVLNKNAIASYNERIEREGLPLAQYRTF